MREALFYSTVSQARQTCCRVLVQEHTDRICESVESFLTNHQTVDLHRLFSLFSELPKENALVQLKVGTPFTGTGRLE